MEELGSHLLQNNFARMVSIIFLFYGIDVRVYSVTDAKAININSRFSSK
jgi:hypothetical protein